MKIKTNKGLKVTIIAVVLLLCLALAIGITGAFYQAKRQTTGTLSMDQGIIIDYKGFGKTPNEGIWSRENKTTFLLFGETNAQPGQNIPVNAAGIRANEKSVNFYARVKLSYKFYNGETPVELADATKLIKTSSSFFGTNWVESGDGYYYYATDTTTLNKFAKTSTTFVDLFATDAKFVIEGAGFTGADNNGESGGFKIDDTTSINKIEVYLTLETLQGDATAEQAKALGWEIMTGGAEGENVVELTPEDYTSTTTTDETTGEEKTIYTPSETFVGKNPKYAFTFSLNDTDKTATITGPVGKPTELDIPSKLIVKGQDYTTTSIGIGAFAECSSLTSVTIGSGVTGIGDYAFMDCDSLTSITTLNSVKSIGSGAFYNCSSLTSITIGNSVKSIGSGAFGDCNSLTSITIGSGVTGIGDYAFNRCYALAEVYNLSKLNITAGSSDNGKIGTYAKVIHTTTEEPTRIVKDLENGIAYYVYEETKIALTLFDKTKTSAIIADDCTEINQHAFEHCSSLTSAAIPNSVKSVGEYAFMYCRELTTITIESGVTSIGDYAFQNCEGLTSITFPDSVTSIGKYAFCGCSSLTSLTIPDSVTSIGIDAFSGCSGLTSITIGSGVTSIGYGAFAQCSGLTSITIPDSVTSIGKYAFSGCSGLTSLTIPDSVTSIGEDAFGDCNSLTSVTIGSGVTSIGIGAFSSCSGLEKIKVAEGNVNYHSAGNCLIETASKTLILGCKTSIVPTDGSVTSIGHDAFEGCSGLTFITIPDSVTSIGGSAFHNCSGLTSITIPEGVTSIGGSAFHNCSGLTSITIPEGVTSIEPWTFGNCSSLTSITIPDSVTNIGKEAFWGCSGLTTKISDIGGTWVKVSDNTTVDASTLLKDIDYQIKRTA